MAKRRWSLEEEKILVEVYFRREDDWPVFYIVDVAWEELHRHGYERSDNTIRAKIYDIAKVDHGLDISHVSKNTIEAYLEYPEKPKKEDSLVDEMHFNSQQKQFDLFNNSKLLGFLPSNNPFSKVQYSVDPEEDKPSEDFQEYFNNVIEDIDFFKHIKWSTIYTFAEISHTTANEMRNGKTKIDKLNLFRIMIAMRLDDPKKIYSLMKKAGFAFSSFSPDKIVAMALKLRIRDKTDINEALMDDGCEPLFKKHAKLMHQI